jgi:hypothetical protein
MTDPVRIRAVDTDDLQVMSALLQDALLPISDMAYVKDENRFVMAVNRYRWDRQRDPSRTHALVSISHVEEVQWRGIERRRPDQMLALLGVTYNENFVQLEFSGSGSVRLRVTELDCSLQDLGDSWPAMVMPSHETD